MNEIEWYFPESLEEVSGMLDKAQPHGGGTSILKGEINRVRGLIHLGRLNLDFLKKEGSIIRIGALQTYAEVVKNIGKKDPAHILVKALRESSCESLRNRITVGGSIASFHIWSDIMGPLLALEAEVALIGKREGSFPISQFVENRDLKRGTLITEVSFKDEGWVSSYHRETRTSFDHAIFTITILFKKAEDKIGDIRIVIIGTKKRFVRLNKQEESLRDKPLLEVSAGEVAREVELDFPKKQSLSPDYVGHLARVQLERELTEVLRQ